jgi:hypothetical protein
MQCHIHADACFTANVVLYLYKYLYKGPDTTKFNIVGGEAVTPRSEVDDHQLIASLLWDLSRRPS